MRGDVHPVRSAKDRRGHEQRGGRFAVVLQSDGLPLSTVIVAPTSTSARAALSRPEVHVGDETTRVLVEQMTAVDWSRLGQPVTHLSHDEMRSVNVAIRDVLSL